MRAKAPVAPWLQTDGGKEVRQSRQSSGGHHLPKGAWASANSDTRIPATPWSCRLDAQGL
jgi:hypothetical protein